MGCCELENIKLILIIVKCDIFVEILEKHEKHV